AADTGVASTVTLTPVTSVPTTTTPPLPSCGVIGAACGSCGNGICRAHCGASGTPLICLVGESPSTTVCADDSACTGVPGSPNCGSSTGAAGCGTLSSGCFAACP